ncbi:hypothetical protein J6590_011999 [Homalodisca vitripennis]|nr:hypothetical protein J6590_011999 [Homalodisca vitripennis]
MLACDDEGQVTATVIVIGQGSSNHRPEPCMSVSQSPLYIPTTLITRPRLCNASVPRPSFLPSEHLSVRCQKAKEDALPQLKVDKRLAKVAAATPLCVKSAVWSGILPEHLTDSTDRLPDSEIWPAVCFGRTITSEGPTPKPRRWLAASRPSHRLLNTALVEQVPLTSTARRGEGGHNNQGTGSYLATGHAIHKPFCGRPCNWFGGTVALRPGEQVPPVGPLAVLLFHRRHSVPKTTGESAWVVVPVVRGFYASVRPRNSRIGSNWTYRELEESNNHRLSRATMEHCKQTRVGVRFRQRTGPMQITHYARAHTCNSAFPPPRESNSTICRGLALPGLPRLYDYGVRPERWRSPATMAAVCSLSLAHSALSLPHTLRLSRSPRPRSLRRSSDIAAPTCSFFIAVYFVVDPLKHSSTFMFFFLHF